ncbi:GNAT family N-acetyltransferase [Actibacterium sp. 188UL27-1]|uniref:GNAT family N-acetyltransferase n=1 Tax=Actibacterium sp. 188UL27-1 TaxID=2786961 RepID=UPI0019579CD8|nr:GNAT family N-acetyltransferase [Actibacterium sp. 188UL27-1]
MRSAQIADAPELARIWHDAWHDAHAGLVPAALVSQRSPDEFHQRMAEQLPQLRVTGPVGALVGLVKLIENKVDDLFIDRPARGTGAAQALLADVEASVKAAGRDMIWLVCAIGNDRAARFYEKSGWHRVGDVVIDLQTTAGPFSTTLWRYEKRLF